MHLSKKTRIAGAAGSVALLAGVAALVTSSNAASLGGLGTPTVGQDSSAVLSCDTDGVSFNYTESLTAIPGTISLTHATMMNVNAACDGKNLRFALYDSSDNVLGEYSGTIALTGGSTGALALSAPVEAEQFDSIAAYIIGW